MASLPHSSAVAGTPSSLIESYRRAQFLVANSTVLSSEVQESTANEESGFIEPYTHVRIEDDSVVQATRNPLSPYDGVFEWDDVEPEPVQKGDATLPRPDLPFCRGAQSQHLTPPISIQRSPRADEKTPLLPKVISLSTDALSTNNSVVRCTASSSPPPVGRPSPILRRSSTGSSQTLPYNYGGNSTFGQTLFNSIAILLGIGMLSEPLAFAYSGWVGGTLLIVFYGFLTCYTAKILSRIILSDPQLHSYSDIGRKAFGSRSTVLTSALFCLELFAVSVVLITLYADSLHTVVPIYSSNTYKLWGLIVFIPTVFLPLSLLSYASVLGIVSTLLIIVVIFIDGFTKYEAPGSLWSPSDTSLGVESWSRLGIAFGLFMAGFSGHAVIPSLARDMIDPLEFDRMINWAFAVATFLYALIGYAGYLMFGQFVSSEVSIDLLKTPGFNPLLNEIALWMLVISPLSKFALATRPLNTTLEAMLGLQTELSSHDDLAKPKLPINTDTPGDPKLTLKRVLTVIERVVFTFLSVGVSILIPEFSSMMAFLGAFSAFIICVIGPISAKVVLAGRLEAFDAILLVIATVMATWGTAVAFW